MNSHTKRNNIAIPAMFWDLLEEQYGHITPSKSAQLRLVLHLWAESVQLAKYKAAETARILEGS